MRKLYLTEKIAKNNTSHKYNNKLFPKKFFGFFVLFLLFLGGGNVSGQTPNGVLDFGNPANNTTATTANTGFGGVRVGNGGGGFTLQNPGQSIGELGELRGIAPTGASVNSVGITSNEYGTATTTFTISFDLYLSGGASGTWYFFAGNGTSFAAAQSSGFTGNQVFTGIQWGFGGSNAITTNNRNAGNWNATGIIGTPFAQNTVYKVVIVGNNSSSTVNYEGGNSVAAYKYDLWINNVLVGNDLAKGQLGNGTSINAFRFYGESSAGNVAQIALDNVTWYNTCVLPSTTTTYSVTYDGNTNTGGSVPVDDNEYEEDDTVTVKANTGNLEKTGYTFNGWNTKADGSGTDYNATGSDTFSMPDEDVTLYAQWQVKTYTVTYNGNTNTGGTAPVDSNSPYNHGSTVTVLGKGDLVKTDHTFTGWNTASDGLGDSYAEDDEITNITENKILYAQWQDNSLLPQTITFGALSAVTYGDSTFNLTATASSNLTVTYTSSDENIATVSGNTVTITGAGSTTITASQAGDGTYQPAEPVQQTLTVNPKNLTIIGVSVTPKTYDGNTTASYTGGSLSGVVGGDSVGFTGTVEFETATAGGGKTVIVDFSLTGAKKDNYTLTQPILTGTINKANQTITGFENLSKFVTDASFNLPANTNQGLTISYESSNTAVATISGNTVTIEGLGTTNITATQAGNGNYNDFEDTITLTVLNEPVALAQWDFTGEENGVTSTADNINTNLNSGSAILTRGSNAPASSGANSFRTAQVTAGTGFRNDGISTSNTDYFQTSFSSANGVLSFLTIDARFVGTATFVVSPGVTTQFAYSFDNTNYTLISSSLKTTIGSNPMEQVDLSGVSALQNISAGTTVYFRFYASGQTTTGGFGFSSPSSETFGLQFHGNIVVSPNFSTDVTKLENLNYEENDGPSDAKSFKISGASLDGSDDVVVSLLLEEDSDFEISDAVNGTYSTDPIVLNNYDGTPTDIFVRLKTGKAIGEYEDVIIVSGYGLGDKEVEISGEVTPPAPVTTVSETALSGFTYVLGGNSNEKTFTVGGTHLTSDITVTAPTNYQVSLENGTGYADYLELTPTGGTVNTTTIYVRLKSGLGINNYNGNITVSATGIANKTVALSGSVTCGVISAFPFTETFENDSASRDCWTQQQVTGSFSWTFQTGAGNGAVTSAYNGTLNARFFPSNGSNLVTKLISPVMDISELVNPRVTFYHAQEKWINDQNELKVYYRPNEGAEWTLLEHYTANTNSWTERIIDLPDASTTYQLAFEGINKYGYGVVLDNITVDSHIIPPTITATPDTVPAFNAVIGGTPDSKEIVITSQSLTEDITVTLDDDTHFSISDESFEEGGTLTITYNPTAAGTHSATVTLSSEGADDVVLNLSGTATLAAPVATDATDVTSNSFTAKWNAVSGAASYELDVYTKSTIFNEDAVLLNNPATGNNQPIAVTGWTFTNIATANDYLKMCQANINNGAPTIISQVVDVTNYTTLKLNADIATFGSPSEIQRTITISISTNNGATWTPVGTRARSENGSSYETMLVVNLDAYIGYSQLRFKIEALNATTSVGARLKNIVLSGNENVVTSTPISGSPFTISAPDISHNVTGLDADTEYHYVVRAKAGAVTSDNSNEITVTTVKDAVWESGNWRNSVKPDNKRNATINDELEIDGTTDKESFECMTLTVNAPLTIKAEQYITVNRKIVSSEDNMITVESDGNLVQKNTGADENSENKITVKRIAKMKRQDYTYWTSPVKNQNLKTFSPNTLNNRFYTYNESNDGFTEINPVTNIFGNSSSGEFESAAKGYAIRSYNTYPTDGTVMSFTGTFNGQPNNGNISFPLKKTGEGYNLVGNPYPSNIDFEELFANNSTVIYNEAYFWTNVNPYVPPTEENEEGYYYANNYAQYLGEERNPAANSSVEPTNIIKPGQGFIVAAKGNGTLQFSNGVRAADTNGVFFNSKSSPKDRYWLKLTTPLNNFNTIAIVYKEGATNNFNRNEDGALMIVGSDSFYSLSEGHKLAIQGRQYPLSESDVVPLGAVFYQTGTHTISITRKEGIFNTGQPIYLKDKQTGILTDLSKGNYTFTANKGESTGRFEVVYQSETTLGTDEKTQDNIVVYRSGNDFVIKSQNNKITGVEMYDPSGRLVYTTKANNKEVTLHSEKLANGMYILKINRGEEVTNRKVIK